MARQVGCRTKGTGSEERELTQTHGDYTSIGAAASAVAVYVVTHVWSSQPNVGPWAGARPHLPGLVLCRG